MAVGGREGGPLATGCLRILRMEPVGHSPPAPGPQWPPLPLKGGNALVGPIGCDVLLLDSGHGGPGCRVLVSRAVEGDLGAGVCLQGCVLSCGVGATPLQAGVPQGRCTLCENLEPAQVGTGWACSGHTSHLVPTEEGQRRPRHRCREVCACIVTANRRPGLTGRPVGRAGGPRCPLPSALQPPGVGKDGGSGGLSQ